MKTLVITEKAFVTACNPEFPLESALVGESPFLFENVFLVTGKRCVLIATAGCTDASRLLVIGQPGKGFFDPVPVHERGTVLERCVRIALRGMDKKIALSPYWMPYRENSRSSVFAFSGSDLRILAESNYAASSNTYAYAILDATKCQSLADCDPSTKIYEEAMVELPTLFKQKARDLSAGTGSGPIELKHIVTKSVAKGFAYDEWLPLLSAQQRDFVERETNGPIRVRGAAGTGKTLAMVLKALKVAKDSGDDPPRILFLTHSWAMASQVDEMIHSIGRDIPSASLIDVYPLLEISSQRNYNEIGRRPLGLDSEAGKRETLKIVSSLVDAFQSQDWVAYRSGCSEGFVNAIEAPSGSRTHLSLSWDILIEFACVLAAQGLLGRTTDRERYLRIRRVGYMMPLNTATEKEVVFKLWANFLAQLRDEGLISSDQIVSDYLNELQTFYWEAKRVKEGYDYIFVDEMHLFNAQERLVFHNLLADGDSTPRVIMALDPKQSPREVFIEISDDRDSTTHTIYERARLPNPEKVDLVDVYRYTVEIAALTKSVLDSVPALDMDDDWNLPAGTSVAGNGPMPEYFVEADARQVFKRAMNVALSLQPASRLRGGQVAVLCMDYDRFNTYQKAVQGQYPRDVFVIRSRDDVERLRYMTRRIVFSTPEYVAGLQFDAVVLVDVNANLVPDVSYRGHQERRFLSELYLGMSRAQNNLVLIASQESDGLSPYLQKQVDENLIKRG